MQKLNQNSAETYNNLRSRLNSQPMRCFVRPRQHTSYVWQYWGLPKKRNSRNPLTYYEIHLYIAKTN